jgi:hypothetical protein
MKKKQIGSAGLNSKLRSGLQMITELQLSMVCRHLICGMLEFTDLKNESEHQLTMWYHKFLEAPYAVDELEASKEFMPAFYL